MKTSTWCILAPVFNDQGRLAGYWLDYALDPSQAGTFWKHLTERLAPLAVDWLFVMTSPTTPPLPALSKHLGCETIAVQALGADHSAMPAPTNKGWISGWYGASAELSTPGLSAGWLINHDHRCLATAKPWAADRLAHWDDCTTLLRAGCKALLFPENRRLTAGHERNEHTALMRLLGLMTRDAEIEELEDFFKHQPQLGFALLKLVNSSGLAVRQQVTNFRQAITLLGRRQLQRWLQLLLFSSLHQASTPNILLFHSAGRGRLMESVAIQLGWADVDSAFMVGMFSLLDVLMGMPLEQLIRNLGLPEQITTALLDGSGDLGALLYLAVSIERRDPAGVAAQTAYFGLDAQQLFDLQLDTLNWVNQFSAGV